MQITPDQIQRHLKQQTPLFWLIHGDETLLVEEACGELFAAYRQLGFSEREVLDVDRSFDWQRLLASGQSMSLFGEKKIIDLRLTAKPDKAGSDALQSFIEQAGDDNVLIVRCPYLNKQGLKSKWAQAFDRQGAVTAIASVDKNRLPQWIRQRLQKRGMGIDNDALQVVVDRVEGNLLAAAQEVEKLQVLVAEGESISLQTVEEAVSMSARYDLFRMLDAALLGDADAAIKMLLGLQAEGAQSIPITGALARELRQCYDCAWQLDKGAGIDRVLNAPHIWSSKKRLYKAALQRHPLPVWESLLKQCAHLDRQQKGQAAGNPWHSLAEIIAAIAGRLQLRTTG